LSLAFGAVGLDWQDHVVLDKEYIRPAEVDLLCGNPAKAREKLGWSATTKFDALIRRMVESDWKLAQQERLARDVANAR